MGQIALAEGQDTAITDLLMRVSDGGATVAVAEFLPDFFFDDPITLAGVMTDASLVDSFFV